MAAQILVFSESGLLVRPIEHTCLIDCCVPLHCTLILVTEVGTLHYYNNSYFCVIVFGFIMPFSSNGLEIMALTVLVFVNITGL